MGKKKITQILIDEATKDELLDIAGRLGIEDKVNYKMLKAEVYDVVLTEFLAQEEAKQAPEPTSEPTVPAAAPGAIDKSASQAFTYAIVKGGVETHVPAGNLSRLLRPRIISPLERGLLEQRAMRDGQASIRKLRRTRAGDAWITIIVRYS